MTSSNAARWMIAAAIAGFVVRVAFALFYWVGQPLTHDEHEYLALARSLARGEGFEYPADEPAAGTAARFDRAPGYPAFLAVLHDVARHDSSPARVKVAQAVVGAVGVWLIGLLAARTFGPRAGVAAATAAAFYPPLVWMPSYVLSETLYSTLALAAAVLLERGARDRGGDRTALVAGAALVGAATLVRPAMLLFVPIVVAWLGYRRRIADALVVAAVVAACILPWTVRNIRTEHRFVLIASEGGVTFWTGNHPLARGDGDLAANPAIKRDEIAFRQRHPDLSAAQLEPLYYRAALSWIAGHPRAWLMLEFRKAFFTVVPIGPSYRLHSTKYFAASVVSYGTLLFCAGLAVGRLGRGAIAPTVLWLMALSAILTGLAFFPQERFRIPVVDPALLVTAASLAAPAMHGRTGRRSDV